MDIAWWDIYSLILLKIFYVYDSLQNQLRLNSGTLEFTL